MSTSPGPTTPPPDVLADALALGALGWRVLPIGPGTKHPPLPQWQRAASSDPATITSWFTGIYRRHGLGVACGPMADGWTLFVVDVDLHGTVDGTETLAALEAAHKPLPATVEARTGSDGRHLFWRAPPGVVVRNSAGSRLGAGLDIRGDGGQVVVAPSLHPNGRPYEWVRSPLGHPVAKAPAWLLALVGEPAARPEAPKPAAVTIPVDLGGEDSIAAWVNDTHRWEDVLAGDGWTPSAPRGDQQAWTRPGKSPRDGTSAVLHLPDGPFVVFSTSVPALQQPAATTQDGSGWSYSMFGYLAATRHGGDRSACARAARAERTSLAPHGGPPAIAPPVGLDVEESDDEGDWAAVDLATVAEEIEAGIREREVPDVLEVAG